MPGPDILNKRKIAVLGSRSVGKSSLVIQFTQNRFVENYYPTIENVFNKTVKYRGDDFDSEIIDTAGQDEYSILNSKYAIGVHGYVLVYSVASRASLEMVKIIYDKIIDYCGIDEIPCVIVGAKSDIKSRQVTEVEAKTFADSRHAAWIETSAKENINIGKVFELCVQEIQKTTAKGQAPKGTPCTIM